MPFGSVSAMDSRRRLVYEVRVCGLSLSEACRRAGVTRKTGRKWMLRSDEQGIENLAELSRAPKSVWGRTPQEIQDVLVCYRLQYPEWGARKLVTLMQSELGIHLPSRTAEHILRREGLTSATAKAAEPVRFERESCGALLQMDFKGLPQTAPYELLTVLDDYGRFCFRFEPVPDKTAHSVKTVLWEMFGEHGLPESMLMDNGDCWGSVSKFPTAFEVWLMKLGIKPIHGRPRHPQTQGKVERFHGTAKRELKAQLVQPSVEEARVVLGSFVDRYNWIRPHDALGLATPGSRYTPFERKRPASLPEHHIPEGAQTRKVDQEGFISYKGRHYRVGKGLNGERLVIQDEDLGTTLSFANITLCLLQELGTYNAS